MKLHRRWFPYGIICLAVGVVFAGCAGALTQNKLTREINKKVAGIDSYYALLETEILTGEMMQSFTVEQWHSSPDRYRVEVSVPGKEGEGKQIFVADGEILWLAHQQLGDFYKFNPPSGEDRWPPFLLSGYWNNILSASEIDVLGKEEMEKGSYYLIELIPANVSFAHARERIWLETKTLLPVRIEVYDGNDNLNQVVSFQRIELNPRLEEQIFKPVKNLEVS